MDASQSISQRPVPINETSRLKPLYISAIVAGTAAIAVSILFAVRPDLMGSLSSIAHKAIPISIGVGGGILIAAGSAGLVFSRRPKTIAPVSASVIGPQAEAIKVKWLKHITKIRGFDVEAIAQRIKDLSDEQTLKVERYLEKMSDKMAFKANGMKFPFFIQLLRNDVIVATTNIPLRQPIEGLHEEDVCAIAAGMIKDLYQFQSITYTPQEVVDSSGHPKTQHKLILRETDERVITWMSLAGRTSYGDKDAMIIAFSRLSMDDIEKLDTLLNSIDSHIKGFKNHSNIPDSPFNIYKTTDGHWNILYLNQKVLQKSPISTDQLYSLVAGMLQNNLYSTVSFQYYARSPSVAFTELMNPNPLTLREFDHADQTYPIRNASPST